MPVKNKNQDLIDSLTTNDVANKLGVAIRSVQLWLDNGILEGWKTPGGHRRIYKSSFDHLVQVKFQHKSALKKQDLKVCIVEEDSAILMRYRQKIASWELPIKLICFNNVWTGLMAIGQSKPDLLIIDIKQPGVSGSLMLKALKTADELKNMLIIVVTGLDSNEINDEGGLPEGVHLYKKHPAPLEEIKNHVLQQLEKNN